MAFFLNSIGLLFLAWNSYIPIKETSYNIYRSNGSCGVNNKFLLIKKSGTVPQIYVERPEILSCFKITAFDKGKEILVKFIEFDPGKK